MKQKIINVLIALLLMGQIMAQSLGLYDLTCEHRLNPIGIEKEQPRFSWKIRTAQRNVTQAYYAIRVATTEDFSNDVIWESGKVLSPNSNLVKYTGPVLESTQRYYWQVKISDNYNNTSGWSETYLWEMGILNLHEWKAKWIEPQQDTLPNGPALSVRKSFNITKKVVRARVYATAHGLYELYLNGSKVSDDLFTPGWTSYHKRLQYRVYDISKLLLSGENTVGALLGDGWYKGNIGWATQSGYYGRKIGLYCQLILEYDDGTKETIISDESWKSTSKGAISMNSIYNGENYNANLEIKDWCSPDYDDHEWNNVQVADYKLENLVPSTSVPVKKIEEIIPIKIWTTPNGTLVADMGQNMVGWVRLKVQGEKGNTITLKYAEVLDKEGEFYTDNLRSAEATTQYTLNGNGVETYEPRFTFMGFRYVSIDGFSGTLSPDNITGIVIHSDMEISGEFECSSPLINQLQKNITWGQKGNFLDIPTDCPQRDERMGWTGDAQAFVRTAAYNMDVAAFFTKWLQDLEADQSNQGAVPFVVPG